MCLTVESVAGVEQKYASPHPLVLVADAKRKGKKTVDNASHMFHSISFDCSRLVVIYTSLYHHSRLSTFPRTFPWCSLGIEEKGEKMNRSWWKWLRRVMYNHTAVETNLSTGMFLLFFLSSSPLSLKPTCAHFGFGLWREQEILDEEGNRQRETLQVCLIIKITVTLIRKRIKKLHDPSR